MPRLSHRIRRCPFSALVSPCLSLGAGLPICLLTLSWLLVAANSVAAAEPETTAEDKSILVSSRKPQGNDAPMAIVSDDSTARETTQVERPLRPIAQLEDYDLDNAIQARSFGRPKAAESRNLQPTTLDADADDDMDVAADEPEVATAPSAVPPAVEVPYVAAKFEGIQPGQSSRRDVIERWGSPVESVAAKSGDVLVYQTKPFRRIEVRLRGDVVGLVKVDLQRAIDSPQLAKQLGLGGIRVVPLVDRDGTPLGLVFPERGVLFVFSQHVSAAESSRRNGPPRVSEIVLRPLNAQAFLLRAESDLHGPYESNLSDIDVALALDPDSAHARWLLADIHLATGLAEKAEEVAAYAVDLEPDNAAYRLRHARCLERVGRYDEALDETTRVLKDDRDLGVLRAMAFAQMGRLSALGPAESVKRAVDFHARAIEIADGLATSRIMKERRAAKDVLIASHLAVAREIARGRWANKKEAVSRWIERASALAEERIASDEGSLLLRLEVAREALAALADMQPTPDPVPWIEEVTQTADRLRRQTDDELHKHRVHWETGIAHFHALRIQHHRGQPESALAFGETAVADLAEGAQSRQALPDAEHLVGRLYFHIGAVHAVHYRDHAEAVVWYDKAAGMLSRAVPVSQIAVPRRQGDALVSMGVSYWEVGQKRKAVELTHTGAKLVEQAVDAGLLTDRVLGVPYGNLATMHRSLGNRTRASEFARLASRANDTRDTKQARRSQTR